MAALNIAPNPQHVSQPQFSNLPAQQQPNINNVTIRERMQQLVQRANFLRANGFTPQTSEELSKIYRVLTEFQQRQKQEQAAAGDHTHPGANGQAPMTPVANGVAATNGAALSSGPIPAQPYPPAPQTPVSFTSDQINALRAQIHAFKLISRGLPVPDTIQQAIRVPNQAVPDLQTLLHGAGVG